MEWIIANKEWLFGGVLVAVPIGVLGWLFAKRRGRHHQNQKAGDNSVNIQAGGNIEIGKGGGDERPNTKGR